MTLGSGDPSWNDRPSCTMRILVDDQKMRVTHYFLRPGERTGMHRHNHDHLVVMFDSGQSIALLEDGQKRALQSVPRFHKINPAGIAHDVCNDSDKPMTFLEVEFKESSSAEERS